MIIFGIQKSNLFDFTPKQRNVVLQLKDLERVNVPDLLDLVEACKSGAISDSSTKKNLRDRRLVDKQGQIPNLVKIMVSYVISGDDFSTIRVKPSEEWLKA